MRFREWFKSKKAKVIAMLGCFAMLLGVGGSVSVVSAVKENEVVETKAATATNLYYAVDTTYTVKANVKLQGDQNTWKTYTMSKVDGTEGIYKATFTDMYDGLATIQFQLYEGDTWKSQVVPFENDWTSASVYNNKLYYNGNWVTTFKEVKKTQTASSSTGRVFFYNSGTHWASGGTCAVYAWGGSATKSIGSNISMEGTFYHFSWFQDDNNEYYGYADIPTNVTGYKIVRLSNSNYVGWSESYYSDNGFTTGSFADIKYGAGSGNYISTGGAHNDVAGAGLLTKVINAYDTCSSSAQNGYGASSNLNNNFYSHATAAAKSASATSLGGSSASIQTHFEAMATRSAGGGSAHTVPGPSRDQSPLTLTLWIVLGAGILGLGAIGTAYFVSKKKKKHQA